MLPDIYLEMLGLTLVNPTSIEAQDDSEQLDDKLDRLNFKVQSLMQGLASLEGPESAMLFDFSSRFNGLLPIQEFEGQEKGFEHESLLSDISESNTLFEHSFIELAAQQQVDSINRFAMQAEDFRSHELRDEEQMLSFDEFVELSNKVACGPRKAMISQDILDTPSTGNSVDCEGFSNSRERYEREVEELEMKICCMRMQGSDVSKFTFMLEMSQKLLAQLQVEVDKTKRINTTLLARQQQLEIQNEKTKAYQAKLKAKMQIVKGKAAQLLKKEEKLAAKKEKASQMFQLKDRLEKALVKRTQAAAEVILDEAVKAEPSDELVRRLPRSQTVRTQASQEKVNKILEETARQNRTFNSLIQKLAVLPQKSSQPKGTHPSPVKPQSAYCSAHTEQNQREKVLKENDQIPASN